MGMDACMLCPRMCGVDRESGEKGYCGMDGKLRAARAALHMWEEPCISGTRGSGAVFFPAAVCGVFSARIMKSHKETVPGRFPGIVSVRFFWNFRKREQRISIW